MRSPVKEHVLVILFKELPSVQFVKIKAMLDGFLHNLYSSESLDFECKTASIPRVRVPDPTFDGSDPNWSDLKIRVQRVYRYVCEPKLFAIQLSNGFMTINALRSSKPNSPVTFEKWCAQCEEVVRFWMRPDLPTVEFEDFHYECVYEFSEEHLLPFLKHKLKNDYFDYFELKDFMHNPCQDPQLDSFDFYPPFYQRAHYQVRKGGESHKIRLEINVPEPNRMNKDGSAWHVRIDMACFQNAVPLTSNLLGAKYLVTLNGVAQLSVRKLLSQSANQYLSDVLGEILHA